MWKEKKEQMKNKKWGEGGVIWLFLVNGID